MSMNTKSLISSKTAWFGAAQIVFGFIGLVFGFLDSGTAMALIVTGLGTIGFRTATSQPIGGVISNK